MVISTQYGLNIKRNNLLFKFKPKLRKTNLNLQERLSCTSKNNRERKLKERDNRPRKQEQIKRDKIDTKHISQNKHKRPRLKLLLQRHKLPKKLKLLKKHRQTIKIISHKGLKTKLRQKLLLTRPRQLLQKQNKYKKTKPK